MPLSGFEHTQLVDGLPVRLKAPHDFSFLRRWGRAVRVLDSLISGNLGFVVEGASGRLFIKYAGAATLGYADAPQGAADRLRAALPRYLRLGGGLLQRPIDSLDLGAGFALAFPFLDAEPLPGGENGLDAIAAWPLVHRLAALDALFELIERAAEQDDIVAGLDGSHMMVSPLSRRLYLTSVDRFIRMPWRNAGGRIPGTARFIAPEGFIPYAPIDERTAVYAMGALALAVLPDMPTARRRGAHPLSGLSAIAHKALLHSPDQRQQTAEAFLDAWRGAVRAMPLE